MARPYYSVEAVIVVDRPERRDSALPVVPEGHRIPWRLNFATYNEAVGWFEAMRRGQWDFASEYVRKVGVLQRDPYGDRGPRTIRRTVERARALGKGLCGGLHGECDHADCTKWRAIEIAMEVRS